MPIRNLFRRLQGAFAALLEAYDATPDADEAEMVAFIVEHGYELG